MKLSNWALTAAVTAGLAAGASAQHGGGAHGAGAGRDADFGAAHASSPHSNFEARLADNPNLSSRLQSLLPPNTTLQAAAARFKNQGQFIAALHVSHNLDIPFSQLKADMTGPDHDSLGQAIHALRPDLTIKGVNKNVKLAEHQTKADLNESTETAEARGSK